MGKRDEAVKAIQRRIEDELDQADAARREADRKRQEELIGSLLPVDSDPNLIGRSLKNLESFLIIGASIFE